MHGNFSAPIEDLQRGIKVLDAGYGSGIWCIEMARDYPNLTFTGSDTANLIPSSSDLPPNFSFQSCRSRTPCSIMCSSVYVHVVLTKDWGLAIKELVRVLKSGGWLESIEGDGERPKDCRLYEAVLIYSQMRELYLSYVHEIPALLASNDIVDIEVIMSAYPLVGAGASVKLTRRTPVWPGRGRGKIFYRFS
ncbi:hypothetical protein BC937DRAFT_86685 [Endogone sp. FLAS-F59071]|nr:hypothetical protein BC937DRAFT_86685 [Endogone sp. FLAS-F59071]|eukprot:RUS19946.1 hypothetical protein BC937DRAFT_86685 [Endogone sp. FLAS-F59071]